jgi:hypothetical protein
MPSVASGALASGGGHEKALRGVPPAQGRSVLYRLPGDCRPPLLEWWVEGIAGAGGRAAAPAFAARYCQAGALVAHAWPCTRPSSWCSYDGAGVPLASAGASQNCCCSVEPTKAVVEDWPPEAATATASK